MKSYKGRLLVDFAKDGQRFYSNTRSLVLCGPCAGCLKACNHTITTHVALSDNCPYYDAEGIHKGSCARERCGQMYKRASVPEKKKQAIRWAKLAVSGKMSSRPCKINWPRGISWAACRPNRDPGPVYFAGPGTHLKQRLKFHISAFPCTTLAAVARCHIGRYLHPRRSRNRRWS